MSVIVKLKNVRLSFPDLWEAVQFKGQGKFYFAAKFIQPEDQSVGVKDDTGNWASTTMAKVIEQVAFDKWGDKSSAVLKAMRKAEDVAWLPVKDGESEEGLYVLSTKRYRDDSNGGAPLVVDTSGAPLSAASGKPYAGCYVNASVEIWPQDNQFGKSIRAKLRTVQFARDGEAFSTAVPISDDEFEPLTADEDDLG